MNVNQSHMSQNKFDSKWRKDLLIDEMFVK